MALTPTIFIVGLCVVYWNNYFIIVLFLNIVVFYCWICVVVRIAFDKKLTRYMISLLLWVKADRHKRNPRIKLLLSTILGILIGADKGNRTLIFSLGSWCSATKLYPHNEKYLIKLPHWSLKELMGGIEPPTYWLRISCSTDWATSATLYIITGVS